MRRARHRLVDDPAEAVGTEVVAVANVHGETVRAGRSVTLAGMNNGIARASESAWRATISNKNG